MNEFTNLSAFIKDEEVEKIKEYGLTNNVPIIQDEGLAFLLFLTKNKNVKKVLEIGTAIGYSSINMALNNDGLFIDTIERDEKMYNEALKNISNLNLTKRIRVHFVDALEISEEELEKDYDLIFIDAAKAQYIKFFDKFTKLLKKGGIVFTDNLLFHGLVYGNKEDLSKNLRSLVTKIESYNDYLKNNQDFDSYFFKIGDGISVSVKK